MDSELGRELWAVIDAEKARAVNLTYAQAQAKLAELTGAENQNSGLTIVTNDVAAKLNPANSCILKGGENG